MITFWNRKEIYLGYCIETYSSIRDILSLNKINYTYKVINPTNPSPFNSNRGRLGSMGLDKNFIYEYHIYVHKSDYEKARFLIHNSNLKINCPK